MMTKTANELKAIYNNPPTREEFETYQKVQLYYELGDIAIALEDRDKTIDDLTDDELVTVVDRYEDELEFNSSPSDTLNNVFAFVLGD